MWSTISKATERVEDWKVPIRYDNLGAYGNLYKNKIKWCCGDRNCVETKCVLGNNDLSLCIHQIDKSAKSETKPKNDEDIETRISLHW